MSTERDDTQVAPENEYFSALDLDEDEIDDLAQVRADDELLDALAAKVGGDDSAVDFDDEQLNALLLAWRHDVDSVAVPEIVDTRTAMATVTAARSARRRRPRMLVPIAAAAAAIAVAFTGVGMAARGAEPGDALWGLSKVLYADHARSVEAAKSVRSDLTDAQQALEQGRIDEAKDALEEAGTELTNVSSEDGKDVLEAEHQELLELLTSNPATPPPAQRSETSKVQPEPSTSATPTPSSTPSSIPTSNTPSSTPSSTSTTQSPSGSDDPDGESPPRSDTPGLPGNGPTNNSTYSTNSTTGDTTTGDTGTETSGGN